MDQLFEFERQTKLASSPHGHGPGGGPSAASLLALHAGHHSNEVDASEEEKRHEIERQLREAEEKAILTAIEESKQVGQQQLLSAVEPPWPELTLDVLDADAMVLLRVVLLLK